MKSKLALAALVAAVLALYMCSKAPTPTQPTHLPLAQSVVERADAGKWDSGKLGVIRLEQDVQAYELEHGRPPKSLNDLAVKPVELVDPFGHSYGYLYPGAHGKYDIVFYGRDGKPGGTGLDSDFGNWQ